MILITKRSHKIRARVTKHASPCSSAKWHSTKLTSKICQLENHLIRLKYAVITLQQSINYVTVIYRSQGHTQQIKAEHNWNDWQARYHVTCIKYMSNTCLLFLFFFFFFKTIQFVWGKCFPLFVVGKISIL